MRIDGSRISVEFLPVLKIIIAIKLPLDGTDNCCQWICYSSNFKYVSTRINADPSVAYQYFLS